MAQARVVRDPIYGYVRVPESFAPLIDHALVQRLRRIAQTSLTSTVYPSATGGRFEHALGTMHLAQVAWAAILGNSDSRAIAALRRALHNEAREAHPGLSISREPDDFAAVVGDALAAAALLHDLGHPPFSHVLEPFFAARAREWLGPEDQEAWTSVWAGQFHEAAGALLSRMVLDYLGEERRVVAELILRTDPDDYPRAAGVLHSVLASEIDIDRIDYLMRDARRAGTEFGAVDHVRLIEALEIRHVGGDFRVAPTARARSAVETLLVQRTQTYKWIIYHHRVVGANEALARAVRLGWELQSEASTAEVFGSRAAVGDLFRPHVPALNYLRPGLAEVRQRTGVELAGLNPQRENGVVRALSEQMQAGVDDSSILEWLKSTSTTARLLLSEAGVLEPDIKERLEEVVAFTDVALLRKRRMVPAWKTIEDFQVVAADLVQRHEIGLRLVEECSRAVAVTAGDGANRVRRYRDELTRTLVRDDGDRMRGLNLLLEIFLSHSDWRRRLDDTLQVHAPRVLGRRGVWATGYTGFRAIRTKGQLASLWQAPQPEPAAIRRTSPLVAALEEAEAARPRLYAYFLLLDGEEAPPLMEVQLRATFNSGFAAFLDEQWAPFLADIAAANAP